MKRNAGRLKDMHEPTPSLSERQFDSQTTHTTDAFVHCFRKKVNTDVAA